MEGTCQQNEHRKNVKTKFVISQEDRDKQDIQ